MATISGTVVDGAGNPVSRRITAYLQESGLFVASATSDSVTGAYSITVPTTAPHRVVCEDGVVDPTCKLLLHFNGENNSTTFIEETGRAVTRSGAYVSTTASVFGGASGYFSSSYLQFAAASDLVLGTQNFKLSARIRPNNVTGWKSIIANQWTNAYNNNYSLSLNGASLALIFKTAEGADRYTGGGTVTAGVFSDVGVVRNGSNLSVTLNGSVVASRNDVGSDYFGLLNVLSIGRGSSTVTDYFSGYIDEVAIFAGAESYPTSFSVPSAPFSHMISYGKNALVYDGVIPA